MPPGLFIPPLMATLIGYGGTLAIVVAAAQAMGASVLETGSWIAGLCLAKAIASIWLSWKHRIPILCAWTTPGAAVIAATPDAPGMAAATGVFLSAALLIMATGLISPLGRLVERIPPALAAAMLAGILGRLVFDGFRALGQAPLLVGSVLAVFLLVRLWRPLWAVLAALAMGLGISFASGQAHWPDAPLQLTQLIWHWPEFDPALILGLGVPLALATMAGQNLPGFAVLRAHGYPVPATDILRVTGLTSALSAPLGAHGVNLAAITAALCMGPDVHPDPARRWPAALVNAGCYLLLALIAGWTVVLLAALPAPLIAAVAGVGLIGSLTQSLVTALDNPPLRFAAVLTFGVSASGLTLFGVGAAFWGLMLGILVLALERLRA